MAGLLSSVAKAIVGFVSVKADGTERAKALPGAPLLPAAPLVEQKRARTLKEFWELHHKPYLEDGHPNTKRQVAYRFDKWIEPAIGHLTWAELTPQVIGQMYRGWIANGYIRHDPELGHLAPQTIGNLGATVSGIVSHAVSLGYKDSNPCTAARRYLPDQTPSARNKDRPQRFEIEDARTLVTSPKIAQVYRDEYTAAIYLCTRRGELHGLRWKNVFLDAPTPYVRIECSYSNPTKTGVVRSVPIHPELMPILRRMNDARGIGKQPTDLVFPNKRNRMQAKNAQHYNQSRDLLGLPDCVYHSLRKTGGTLYRAAGLSKAEVADILGHAKSVTDVYAPVQLAPLAARMTLMSLIPIATTEARDVA